MKELIELLQREWSTISAAPATFSMAAILVAGIAYAAARWRYTAIIQLQDHRLKTKDERLDEYRERLHLLPARGSEFSRQSHSELQVEALRFVDSLREWLSVRHSEDSRRQHQQWSRMTQATDETQKRQLWDAHTEEIIGAGNRLNSEYDAKFKVRAIVLRDELLSRAQYAGRELHVHHMYDHPTNPIGMGMVADDLERLARELK